MGIIAWIVVGLIAGALAKLIMPGDDPGGDHPASHLPASSRRSKSLTDHSYSKGQGSALAFFMSS